MYAGEAAGYLLTDQMEQEILRTLKELLARFDLGLSDVAFAARLESSEELRESVRGWLAETAHRPEDVDAEDWLRFEQEKHQKLLATLTEAA